MAQISTDLQPDCERKIPSYADLAASLLPIDKLEPIQKTKTPLKKTKPTKFVDEKLIAQRGEISHIYPTDRERE